MPRYNKRESFRLPVHKVATMIRTAMGWSKTRMATEVGMALPTWSRYENGRVDFSLRVLERIREVAGGLVPYVLAYFLHYDASKLPEETQALENALRDHWLEKLEEMRIVRHRLPSAFW